MNKYGFLTNLFMSLSGVVFIIISVFLFIFTIKTNIDYDNIEKHGTEIKAKIIEKSIYKNGKSIYYEIEYTINGKTIQEKVEATSRKYNNGDTITIYYLEKSINKVSIPIEKNVIQNQSRAIIIMSIFLVNLGYICIKKFNIFKYKKIIEIK